MTIGEVVDELLVTAVKEQSDSFYFETVKNGFSLTVTLAKEEEIEYEEEEVEPLQAWTMD